MKRYISTVIRFRKTVLVLTAVVTIAFLAQLRSLKIIIDPDSVLPQTHPYIVTGNFIEKVFGNKFTVVIGVTAQTGDIFNNELLAKVERITTKLQQSPLAISNSVTSITARKAKNISGNAEGMVVSPLLDKLPQSPLGFAALKTALAGNPVYDDLLISRDGKTAQIVAEFKKSPSGFQTITDAVERLVAPERDSSVQIDVGGVTIFLALLEQFSERMAFLFPLALLVIGLIHYEAFRTVQGLILPLVTALLAVVWGMGVLSLISEPFDVFNSATPILILAIAAGHAVQILKRYYEEFAKAQREHPEISRKQASELAVLESLSKIGPVMAVACAVAALGFFSLIVFEIKSIQTFGIFAGSGVLSALVLELSFIPALRVMLPAPGAREILREAEVSRWDRLTAWFYEQAMFHRKRVYTSVGLIVLALSLGGYWLKIDNSQKSYFYGKIPAREADARLNKTLAGTNPLYILIKGDEEDAIKRPEVLAFMDRLQHALARDPSVGKTISIVDFLKKMNASINGDSRDFFSIPASKELVAQYLLLYSNSGEPGDFDSLVDYNYQNAVVTIFSRSDSSSVIDRLRDIFIRENKIAPTGVHAELGGGAFSSVALNEIMIREKVFNILQIMAAVFFISSLVFRSFAAGLLILVPLIASVLVNFGVMGLLGIPLEIATALVSAMAVGIGADYGIYMSYRMREELAEDADEKRALKKAFGSAGKAVIFVSTAVAGGFGLLMLSWGFLIHIWLGFLIAVAMIVSSVTALTLFPALIFTFRPKFIFQKRQE